MPPQKTVLGIVPGSELKAHTVLIHVTYFFALVHSGNGETTCDVIGQTTDP